MLNSANNIEYEGNGKKSTVAYNMFIKVDEKNKLIFASDMLDNGSVDVSSNGILTEVNSHLAANIEDRLNIKIADYGVEIFDESVSVSKEDLIDVF